MKDTFLTATIICGQVRRCKWGRPLANRTAHRAAFCSTPDHGLHSYTEAQPTRVSCVRCPSIDPQSVLFITLDSCRFDTFVGAAVPHLRSIGPLHRAMAPGNFTYSSHAAMFVGFTPGDPSRAEPFVNPKFGKMFRLSGPHFPNKAAPAHFVLDGHSIVDGFKRRGYKTIGTGAARWFDPAWETSRALISDFDEFFYSGSTYRLTAQLGWLEKAIADSPGPVFAFLNVGETHVPYYFEGASWSFDDNPCVPFSHNNDADACRIRQTAALEFVDRAIGPLLKSFRDASIFVCADHGDCWGEDGLWEHGFSHPKVLEVPLLFRSP